MVTLNEISTVEAIVAVLKHTEHNGFPVCRIKDGSICGLISARQLTALLHLRVWQRQLEHGGTGAHMVHAQRKLHTSGS